MVGERGRGALLDVRTRRRHVSWARIYDQIRALVDQGNYVVGGHAAERLEERGILEWQAVVGIEEGVLLVERPDAVPNPVVEVRETLPDGTEFKAVWSLLGQSGVAKLVTVHFFD